MRLWSRGNSLSGSHAIYTSFNNAREKETLHLFRALLRQCSYLPDPAARKYLRGHVVSRFRDYHPHSVLRVASNRRKAVGIVEQRRPALLKIARRGLFYLQRANDGYQQHLGHVLSMTYGRIGKRRHQLLKDLKIPDIPTDQAAVEKLSEPGSQDVPHPSQKLMALVRSQARRRLSHFSRSNSPNPTLIIPEKNSWGRPMPIKRVRNYKRRWYAETLDRIMPPLPTSEWEALQKLASGLVVWEGPVPRRKPTGGVSEGLQPPRGKRFSGPKSNPHEITPRFMRRLWVKIFANCPMMRPNASTKSGWDVTWGTVIDASTNFVLPTRGRTQDDLFGGVDERGKVIG